jgi:hypothetical protein
MVIALHSCCYADPVLHRIITSGGGTPVSATSVQAANAHAHIVAADEISVARRYWPQPPAQMTLTGWIYASRFARLLVDKAPHVITIEEED